MRRDTWVPPYRNTLQSRARMPCRIGAACRGGRPCPPGAVDFHKVRRAACPHAAVMVRWLSDGGLRAARPTDGLQEVRCAAGHMGPALQKYFAKQGPCALPWVRERNPPVTALPCQPPLGKEALGTGVRIATTSDIGHWFRNDTGFCKRCSFVCRKYHDSI